MRTANVHIHHTPYYRLDAYKAGLEKCGYRVVTTRTARPSSSDVLLIWNRNPSHEALALQYEKAGATVLVTENGYIGDTKALAKWDHSGAGKWPVGADDRWGKLNIPLKPWREDGDFILVLPQRSIGRMGVAMPRNWEITVKTQLAAMTKRPIIVKAHPGKRKDIDTVESAIANAWACVTWASGAGLKSIIAGVPVFNAYPKWLGADAAYPLVDIEKPYLGDRLPMLKRMAWAQWSMDEIMSGEAFKCILQ